MNKKQLEWSRRVKSTSTWNCGWLNVFSCSIFELLASRWWWRSLTAKLPCAWVAEPFSKWGDKCNSKNSRKVFWFELVTVTSQALQYDVNKFCQHVSNFMQCFISTQRPPSIAYTTPYLSTLYATLTWAHKCNQLFLVLQKIHSQGSRQMRHSQS